MKIAIYTLVLAIGLTVFVTPANAIPFFGKKKSSSSSSKGSEAGILSVKTNPGSYPVKVDGKYVGKSGVDMGAEFMVAPGRRKLEVFFPNGKVYSKVIDIRKDAKNCVCLKYVENVIKRPCPYDVRVDAPESVMDSELITFTADNVSGAPSPALKYRWTVDPPEAQIMSGQGTPTITVDSSGFGGQKITATLDVSTGYNDESCRQRVSTTTRVTQIKTQTPDNYKCDDFELENMDSLKARIDNCVIKIQSDPDSQMYIIIYPGSDRASLTRNTYEKTAARTREYLVKTRNVDPARVTIIQGPTKPRTSLEVWVIPPGAPLPVPGRE